MYYLHEISGIFIGVNPRPKSVGRYIRLLQMKDLKGESVQNESISKVNLGDNNTVQFLKKGDIIFRSRGVTMTAALLDTATEQTALVSPLFCIRANPGVVPEYLLWWINQPTSQKRLSVAAKGSALQMIGKQDLSQLPVILPPPEAQKRIADYYRSAKTEQALLEKIISAKKRHTDALLMNLVRQFAGE